MTPWFRSLGLAVVAAAWLVGAPAAAQDTAPAAPAPKDAAPSADDARRLAIPPAGKRKIEFPTIRAHLLGTLEHSRTGRHYLAQPASVETFEAARKEIYKAYVEIRDAHAGILGRIGREEKHRDPLLGKYEKHIQSARSQLLVAMDQANNGARLKQFRRATRGLEYLDRAMHNVEFVLAVMP